uniref:DNA directed RNA polymerase, 7 kDa subunit n=1 Tax=Siphoviridae sp. ct2hZ16 TaxID=2826276 RepID=A0A8S5QU21_9CAUD|nr:MAG TPA: DNA directed RNA polymerase, 7 kDa subunit [Siphoviridae sp. ct2hZ16]
MNTTIGCPIPGASQPKEPVRLIDIKEVLQYDGAHFTWSGGRNCLSEQKAAYARGYDAGMKFIVDEVKKAPTIDPESLRPTAHWIKRGYVCGENEYECSACHGTEWRTSASRMKYCMFCGKRMVNTDD